jgi:site-specific recombinase XerD
MVWRALEPDWVQLSGIWRTDHCKPGREDADKYQGTKNNPQSDGVKEIEKILKTAYQNRKFIKEQDSYSYLEAIRNIVVVELLFSTGGRVSEIANLKENDINLRTGEIIINGKGKQTKNYTGM